MTRAHSDHGHPHHSPDHVARGVRSSAKRRCIWLFATTFFSGLIALVWLLLRTGNKPGRITYPCQQAALAAATQAFGGSLVAILLATRCGLARMLKNPLGLAAGALGIFVCLGLWTHLSPSGPSAAQPLDPPDDYRARVFHVTNCPQDPVDTHFVGLDNLIALMGHHGLKFYRYPEESLVAGPEGIIGAEDVVLIKINYQWERRGGTNVDLLRGLIQRIVDHPGAFSGEIVICENTQFRPSDGFDRTYNNAQDRGLSPHDVVVRFQEVGCRISHYDWRSRRTTEVEEYSAGDDTDGYVCSDYNEEIRGRLSYPKFQTAYGTRISLKMGLWNPETAGYSRELYPGA